MCIHAMTELEQAYGGRKGGEGGHEAQQCVVAAQECAGLQRCWMSNDAAPSHSCPNADGAAEVLYKMKVAPCLGRTAQFAYIHENVAEL